jgi:hypothetical protein
LVTQKKRKVEKKKPVLNAKRTLGQTNFSASAIGKTLKKTKKDETSGKFSQMSKKHPHFRKIRNKYLGF